ncbi:MAG: hypothetical protein KatS3mg110_3608 [Pirellulaceae bacterium]|nr:MAG: hypothetical protein KatS3mg110_3608 [Pirellulaceae bacterium]
MAINQVRRSLKKTGRWRVSRPLDAGPFWESYHESIDGNSWALKVSKRPFPQARTDGLAAIWRTALSCHPRFLPLAETFLVQDHLVTVWRRADQTLLEYDQQRRSAGGEGIPIKHLLRYLFQAAEAIDYLNEQGIYHRNVKPSNLFMCEGSVRLGDFHPCHFGNAPPLPASQQHLLAYTSPEIQSDAVHPTCDRYSLIATYVRLRTGQEPFGNESRRVQRRQREGRPAIEQLPSEEAACIRRFLAPSPDDRPEGRAVDWVRQLAEATLGPKNKIFFLGQCRLSTWPAGQPRAQVLTVDPSGKADYRTIAEAVRANAAVPGELTIRLTEGLHDLDSPLEVDRPVRLLGAGKEATVVVSRASPYSLRLLGGGPFYLSGLSIRYEGQNPADVLVVEQSHAVIESCVFSGARQRGRVTGAGLRIESSIGGIVNCRCDNNSGRGILVADSDVFIGATECSGNRYGIDFRNHSAGACCGNHCHSNTMQGIRIGGSSHVAVCDNYCHHNNYPGIVFLESSSGVARRNRCAHHPKNGMYASCTGHVRIEDNLFTHNEWPGLYLDRACKAVVGYNIARHNRHGIAVHGDVVATVEHNNLEHNSSVGIFFGDNSKGIVRGNYANRSGENAIAVGGRAEVLVEQNRCERSGHPNIAFGNDAKVTARRNTCLYGTDRDLCLP